MHLTGPADPLAPLPQVTAPAVVAAPLFQSGLEATKLFLESAVVPPLPTLSSYFDLIKLFEEVVEDTIIVAVRC